MLAQKMRAEGTEIPGVHVAVAIAITEQPMEVDDQVISAKSVAVAV